MPWMRIEACAMLGVKSGLSLRSPRARRRDGLSPRRRYCGPVPTDSTRGPLPGVQTQRGLHGLWSRADGESGPGRSTGCAHARGLSGSVTGLTQNTADNASTAGGSRCAPTVRARSFRLEVPCEPVAYALLDLCTGCDIRMHRKRQRLIPLQSFFRCVLEIHTK